MGLHAGVPEGKIMADHGSEKIDADQWDWSQSSFYQQALDQAAIVAVTDHRGRIIHANENFCTISGYERHELIGQDHRLLNSGHHAKAFFKDLYATIATGKSWRGEICNRSKAGHLYWVDTTIVPMLGDDHKPSHYFAIRQDITSRKMIEMQLADATREAQRATISKDHYLANMSHEIRTPMTAILGFVELMKDPEVSAKQRDELLEVVERNGEHLLSLINDILDLSKMGSGKMHIDAVKSCPIAIVEQVYSLFKDRAAAKSIVLDCVFETDMPKHIMVDLVRLSQVLNNLVGNAIKFTEAGGVELLCGVQHDEHEGDMLRIEVRDTGIGMTPDQLAGVFEAFVQADDSITSRFGGTGLGLSISRKLVQLMGGEIIARSEKDQGSSFTIKLPIGIPESEIELDDPGMIWDQLRQTRLDQSRSSPLKRIALDGVRILIADDSPDNQRLFGHHLRKAGAHVTVADDGSHAIEVCECQPFDLVLMDMQMPVLGGLEATEQLRARGHTLPIIALTANAMAEDRQRCLDAGCDEYLSKPIKASLLVECCHHWAQLGKHRRAA